jgi:4-carboxymuconolactone decarboxylase
LNVGLTPVEIKEAVYQCAPYIGFPKTLNAINEVNEVFKAKNIALPVESQKTVDEDNRFQKGLATQGEIFRDGIKKNVGECSIKSKAYAGISFCFLLRRFLYS